MALQIIFILVSLFTLISAWIVVTNRNLFHAALAMMASFLGVAGIYVLLDAGILAAAQLLVYIGAISILVIFAIMMTRRLMQTTESPFNAQWQGALVGAIVGLILVLIVVISWGSNPGAAPAQVAPEVPAPLLRESVRQLGVALVNPDQYVVPFEVASILLLAALVGAIFIARPRREEE
jgi:NADH-quinone oxidoreductase subunit J